MQVCSASCIGILANRLKYHQVPIQIIFAYSFTCKAELNDQTLLRHVQYDTSGDSSSFKSLVYANKLTTISNE